MAHAILAGSPGAREAGEHAVAAGFIWNDGTVLLARRALTKVIAPGLWHLPGGHLEPGEDPSSALRREILEEFGVDVQVDELLHVFEYTNGERKTVGFAFAASFRGARTDFHADPKDNSEIKWARREELDGLFPDGSDHNYVAAVKGFDKFRSSDPMGQQAVTSPGKEMP
jgi:mutator protein MutT